jgi:hypothetical protein
LKRGFSKSAFDGRLSRVGFTQNQIETLMMKTEIFQVPILIFKPLMQLVTLDAFPMRHCDKPQKTFTGSFLVRTAQLVEQPTHDLKLESLNVVIAGTGRK